MPSAGGMRAGMTVVLARIMENSVGSPCIPGARNQVPKGAALESPATSTPYPPKDTLATGIIRILAVPGVLNLTVSASGMQGPRTAAVTVIKATTSRVTVSPPTVARYQSVDFLHPAQATKSAIVIKDSLEMVSSVSTKPLARQQ
jgi:hypothetical protein